MAILHIAAELANMPTEPPSECERGVTSDELPCGGGDYVFLVAAIISILCSIV